MAVERCSNLLDYIVICCTGNNIKVGELYDIAFKDCFVDNCCITFDFKMFIIIAVFIIIYNISRIKVIGVTVDIITEQVLEVLFIGPR
jgi:hypothetical protein